MGNIDPKMAIVQSYFEQQNGRSLASLCKKCPLLTESFGLWICFDLLMSGPRKVLTLKFKSKFSRSIDEAIEPSGEIPKRIKSCSMIFLFTLRGLLINYMVKERGGASIIFKYWGERVKYLGIAISNFFTIIRRCKIWI